MIFDGRTSVTRIDTDISIPCETKLSKEGILCKIVDYIVSTVLRDVPTFVKLISYQCTTWSLLSAVLSIVCQNFRDITAHQSISDNTFNGWA